MSILTGFKKVKNYILTSSGYQLLSRWTSSQTVEFDDGKTAQTKLGEINGIAKTYVDMKKATDNSMAVSAKAVMEGLENSSALISMTQEEYDALSDEEKTDNNMRAILDANPDVVDAKNVNFDNTNTNLTATNTQSAITELNGKLNEYMINTKTTVQNATGYMSSYKVTNYLVCCTMEITPTDLAHNTLLAFGLYAPDRMLYLSLPTITGGNIPCILTANGELRVYYPKGDIALDRIDFTFMYPYRRS